ncbi:MAG: DUF58 domain-containing protein [Chloroflexota bacterium]
MTRRPSPRLRAYLVLGAAGLIAGIALERPEPVLIVAPLLLAALLAMLLVEVPAVTATVSLASDRVLEGDEVRLNVELRSASAVPWLEIAVALPGGLRAIDDVGIRGLRLGPDQPRAFAVEVVARRWGSYRVGRVVLRSRDRFGFFAFETTVDEHLALRVFPKPETLRHAISPAETQMSAGNEVSRRRGDGVEFADVRQYAPGDVIRRVNWRLSSRRPELHVNELHPESSTEVVILLDTFTDLTDGDEQSSLATGVRAANGIANYYLRRRDRVGLIAFGGSIRWLVPAMGLAQSYRIVEVLLDARAAASIVWKGVDLIPPRSLPPKALVIAVSPLLDDRTIESMLDLRGRGFDLAVIELPPEGFMADATDEFELSARRLWQLRRAQLRDRLQRLGVPIAAWTAGEPLDAAMEEVRAFRRYARRALA